MLEFTVKDHDKWTKNSTIGTLEIAISDVLKADDKINKQYKLENAKTGYIYLALELLSVYSSTEIRDTITHNLCFICVKLNPQAQARSPWNLCDNE